MLRHSLVAVFHHFHGGKPTILPLPFLFLFKGVGGKAVQISQTVKSAQKLAKLTVSEIRMHSTSEICALELANRFFRFRNVPGL